MLETILFVIGLVGLIGGNLTVSKRSPVKGRRARLAGLILMMPLLLSLGIWILVNQLILSKAISPLMETPLLRWLDLVPATLGILGSFVYLHFTNPNKNPDTFQFWLAATLPAIGLYVAFNLTDLFRTLFDMSMRFPLQTILRLAIP